MKKGAIPLALGVFALAMLLFYVVYEYVFFVNLFQENVVGLTIWSLFAGLITFIYAYFERKFGLGIFLISYVAAFIALFVIFSNTDYTFANITGLLSFIYILIGGFALSFVVEAILWFTKRKKPSDQ